MSTRDREAERLRSGLGVGGVLVWVFFAVGANQPGDVLVRVGVADRAHDRGCQPPPFEDSGFPARSAMATGTIAATRRPRLVMYVISPRTASLMTSARCSRTSRVVRSAGSVPIPPVYACGFVCTLVYMEYRMSLPEHDTHNHCLYGLDCAQFEALLTACGQCCQGCDSPSGTRGARKLFIDHDHSVGDWAVRGMLCAPCNATLRYDRSDPEWATPYLNDPWWKGILAGMAIHADMPEPNEDRVLDFYGRLWFRRANGWSTGFRQRGSEREIPWQGLLRKYGPHNLTPFSGPRLPPKASIQRVMRDGIRPSVVDRKEAERRT